MATRNAAWAELDAGIHVSAEAFGEDGDTLLAARVIMAGMWERDAWELCKLLTGETMGCVWKIKQISKRLYAARIWDTGNLEVRLCCDNGDVELWLSAMVGTGQLDGHYDETARSMMYRARPK